MRERTVWERPFCRLIHFEREIAPERAARDPRILLVEPMSGHFAKLKEAGLIQADQHGTTIIYSINLSTLEEVLLGFMGRIGVSGEKGDTK